MCAKMEDITIVIRGQEFPASKEKLVEYSDYFRAMFSGRYVEHEQKQVVIDVLEPDMMSIILQYIQIGLIDLSEYTLTTLGSLAGAANFLQITELIKQIAYNLQSQISISNWIEIMDIAEVAAFTKVSQLAAAQGLLSFKDVKLEDIPSIRKLFWYLSHTHLMVLSEFDVFKFGQQWISHNEVGADALMVILCCLDYNRLTSDDLQQISTLMSNSADSLAEKVIACLCKLAEGGKDITVTSITTCKSRICENFTERVYTEILNLVRHSIKRQSLCTPAVPMWIVANRKPEVVPHYLYTYTKENECQKWLEVAEKNIWGWSVVSWGLTKIVVFGGEHGRGTGIFMKDVRVYDTLTQEWTQHGVQLPARRHAGAAVIGDSLFIIGGVGAFRVVLDTAIVYDLKQRTYRKIAKFPETVQNPAVCAHDNEVYACGQRHIFKYEEKESTDHWIFVLHLDIRANHMISFKQYIYCTQNFYNQVHRFIPSEGVIMIRVTCFSGSPAALCNLGNHVLAFTSTAGGHSTIMRVEEMNEHHNSNNKPTELWVQSYSDLNVNDVAGCCVVVTALPPMNNAVSQTHKCYLQMFDT